LWEKKPKEITDIPIPKNLISLLETSKKSELLKLINGLELSATILLVFIFEAYSKYGFKFSEYRTEILPTGTDMKKMPYAAEIKENGDLNLYGTFDLSKGQIKQAIKHRTVTIGKILEKDDVWHCFLANYKSLNGEEIWLDKNKAHYHNISNSFGLTHEKLIEELKSKKYKLGNLPHIKLNKLDDLPE